MGQTETPEFDAAGFKAKLMARIADMAPKNLEEADNFKNNNQLESVKGDLSGQVKDEQKASKDPLAEKAKETPDTSGIEAKQVTPLPPNDSGAETSDIGADKAAPKPKSQDEVEAPLQAESQKLDQQMAEANVTEEQLENSNEPAFQGALASKKEAQTKAPQAPQEYRQQEEGLISNAKNTAVSTAQQLLQAMHGTRTQSLGQVTTQQTEAKSKDEQARAKIAGDINKIYDNTKTKVEQSLADLDSLVLQAFDTGAGKAKKAFEDYVKQKMDAYKDERYSGLLGPGKWLKDKFMGLPSEVNVFYEEGRQLYIAKMDGVINNVVSIVSKGITKAKTEITNSKQEIQTYIQQLPEDLKAVGQEAATEIQTKFDDLQQQVNDKQDELVNTLAEKYQENLQAVDDSIEKMKSENKGLLQKAAEAFMGVIKTILEMKDLLLSALAGAAAAVMDILKNPIQFLTNLIQAVKQGFLNFVKNIGQYLQQGLMAWLTGTIGGAGLQMPESFDIKGIFSLVTQVLGFTYDFIRGRAANKLGEEKVTYLEQGEETFKVLSTQGLAGIWHLIQDKIGDIKTMVMDGIQSFVMTSIVQAGVEWVLSLLTPASAFVKACKMIIDIVKFFIERGSQIAALIGAITSSISAIASGAVGEAIQAIESALARSIPVALGFLASLLGLGGISEKIQGIIQKVRQPVAKAVDWVIDKGAKVLNKVGGKFKKTKFGSKVVGVKNAAQEKYKAGKKFVEDKKAAGEKWFEDKKQAVHQATEKQKNRFLNSKAGKALTRVNDAAHKKLDALEKKRQAFKNKIDAVKEWPGKQLEKVQDKAAELGGRAKDKLKQSKLGKGFANQLDKAKDWGGKKKAAVQDWAKHKLGIKKDKDVKNSSKTKNKSEVNNVKQQSKNSQKQLGNNDKHNKNNDKTKQQVEITAVDRIKHEKIAAAIKENLIRVSEKTQLFDNFYKLKTQQAKDLENKYQSKLKPGIGLKITIHKLKQQNKDNVLDFNIRIAPNTTELTFPVTWEQNNGIRQEFIDSLTQEYQDILAHNLNTEGIPKYQDLKDEMELLKNEDTTTAKEHFEKIKKQVEVIREIAKRRDIYKALGHEIGTDRVVIYGAYDLTITPKKGGDSKHITGKYNAVSSQVYKPLEDKFNESTGKDEERMMPTQNQYLRFFKVNLGMVNKSRAAQLDPNSRFPNPTHDAETKLFEYVARQIVNSVHGNLSPEEQHQEDEIHRLTNEIKEDKSNVPALSLKEELKTVRDRIKGIKKQLQEIFETLKELSQFSSSPVENINETNYKIVQTQLQGEKDGIIAAIKSKNKTDKLTRKQQQDINKLYDTKLVDKLINELQSQEGKEEELDTKLSKIYNQLKGTTDKEVSWLDEESKKVQELKEKAANFQNTQDSKLQQVIDNWKVTGSITINDEQSACTSCSSIIQEFVNKLQPSGGKINITVTPAVQFYYGKRGQR